MFRYSININYGDNDRTHKFYFVHKEWQTLSNEEQDKAFHEAVTELNRIYQNYGRFATQVGVTKFFNSFGFDRTIP